MKLVLYNYWRSSASHRVRIGLELKALAYDYVAVNIVKHEQQHDAYRARNPMAQVPTLEITDDDGAVHAVSQSLPILELLDERFATPAGGVALLPADPYRRAATRALAEIVNSGIQPFQNLPTLERVRGLGGDSVAFARGFIESGLAAFELASRALAGPFSAGAEPSLADCCLIPQLAAARRFGAELGKLEHVLAIEARCLAMPAFQRAAPERQPDAVK